MANPIGDIPARIIAIMRTDTNYNGGSTDIAGFLIGQHPIISIDRYPLCEIVTETEDKIRVQTGILERQIIGFVRFSVRLQDILSWDANDTTTVTSEQRVNLYVNQFKILFDHTSANRLLNNPTIATDGYRVQRFEIENAEYGLSERSDSRSNNYENQGVIAWTCDIQENRI